MSRPAIPLDVDDISKFARNLSQELGKSPEPPSHLSLMNMLARASGFANFQHLKASQAALHRLSRPQVVGHVDHRLLERALSQFDDAGKLLQWPGRRMVQDLVLWPLWARLPERTEMTEREISQRLNKLHRFEDAAILRRSLVTQGLFKRTTDGKTYLRIEQKPQPTARALIDRLSDRWNGRAR